MIPSLTSGFFQKENNKAWTLKKGRLIPDDQRALVKSPWRCSVTPTEHGLTFVDYYSEANFMSKRMVDTLQKAGVDNLVIYPAEVTNTETGEVNTDFVAVNIIGLVSCAVMDQSKANPLASTNVFHDLVIDPKKIHGIHMFRLAESPMVILVSEQVATALEAGNFEGFSLEPVKEVS
jgi:hypothetical protein